MKFKLLAQLVWVGGEYRCDSRRGNLVDSAGIQGTGHRVLDRRTPKLFEHSLRPAWLKRGVNPIGPRKL